MDNVLLYFSLKYKGDWSLIYKALDEKQKIETSDLLKVNYSISNNFISIINPLYPSSLKKVIEPSFVLYFKGCISLLHDYHRIIGFIGGDLNNKYNKDSVIKIVNQLIEEKRIILLSEETLMQSVILDLIIEKKAKVILVTSKPLQEYLKSSKFVKKDLEQTDYLIISEVEMSSMFRSDLKLNYSLNSKLVCGFSKALVILENKNIETINSVIEFAKKEDKKIFAIPQPILSEKSQSNQIIKQKAFLIDNASDILTQI